MPFKIADNLDKTVLADPDLAKAAASLSGYLVCFKEWDHLDNAFEIAKKLDVKDIKISRRFNPEALHDPAIEYPFTLGFVCTNDTAHMEYTDDIVSILLQTKKFTGEHEIFMGNPRILDFMMMLPLDPYAPGMVKIRYGRCPVHALNSIACNLCFGGHMLECHHPLDCKTAKCAHYRAHQLEYDAVDCYNGAYLDPDDN